MAPGAAGLALLVCLAQAAAPAPELPVSVERIQRELAKPVPAEPARSLFVFRVSVEARPLRFSELWDPGRDTVVPNYVRPRVPLYHHEFLESVTPETFRAGVLFPISVDVLPAAERLADAIRQAIRRRHEERARREVDEALRQLLEARKKKEAEKK